MYVCFKVFSKPFNSSKCWVFFLAKMRTINGIFFRVTGKVEAVCENTVEIRKYYIHVKLYYCCSVFINISRSRSNFFFSSLQSVLILNEFSVPLKFHRNH